MRVHNKWFLLESSGPEKFGHSIHHQSMPHFLPAEAFQNFITSNFWDRSRAMNALSCNAPSSFFHVLRDV